VVMVERADSAAEQRYRLLEMVCTFDRDLRATTAEVRAAPRAHPGYFWRLSVDAARQF
jgi:hypothetical protein